MKDTVLEMRISALENRLENALHCQRIFKEAFVEPLFQRVSRHEDLVLFLEKNICLEANHYQTKLREMRKSHIENESDAFLFQLWDDYYNIYSNSHGIFAECLELIGGVAIRDYDLNANIYKIADELIFSCSRQCSNPWNSITVPTLHGSREKARTNIIGHRFLDLSIWSLPYLIREYSFILLDDNKKLKDSFESIISNIINPSANHEDRQRFNTRYQVFFSDLFATYFMGPSYPCSIIFKYANPFSRRIKDNPNDEERVFIIINMLKKLNTQQADFISPPLAPLIEMLEKNWNVTLNEIYQDGKYYTERIAPQIQNDLCHLTDDIHKLFIRHLIAAIGYPVNAKSEGWMIAQDWYLEWEKQLKERREISKTPSFDYTSKLRDVFNAAWLCRLNNPDYANSIADAALSLCEEIITSQRQYTGIS